MTTPALRKKIKENFYKKMNLEKIRRTPDRVSEEVANEKMLDKSHRFGGFWPGRRENARRGKNLKFFSLPARPRSGRPGPVQGAPKTRGAGALDLFRGPQKPAERAPWTCSGGPKNQRSWCGPRAERAGRRKRGGWGGCEENRPGGGRPAKPAAACWAHN